MRHPLAFTFLGFQFNCLVDSGEHLDIRETQDKIRNKQLFDWLRPMYPDVLDISLFNQQQLDDVEAFFDSLSNAVDASSEFGVEKNGLCLLVAYCLEGVQREEKDLR